MDASILTEGSVRRIRDSADSNNNDKSYRPVMQAINVKTVAGGSAGNPRYRVVLSDGSLFVQGMLATQMAHLVQSGQLRENSVIRVDDFMKNDVAGRPIVILLRAEVLSGSEPHCQFPDPGGRIGNPVDHNSAAAGAAAGAPAAPAASAQAQPLYRPLNNSTNGTSGGYGGNQEQKQPGQFGTPGGGGTNPYGGSSSSQQRNSYGGGGGGGGAPIGRMSTGDGAPITSIKNLNMYNNRWTIRARVTSKSDVRTWSNARGEGSLFSVELLDASGVDIRATFFKEAVDRFYNMLQVGSVYRLGGGRLKVANAQYNTCQSQFEITFDQNSEIHLDNSGDDGSIRRKNYDFVKIADIEGRREGTYVDVAAVVKGVGDVATLVSKKSGQELIKCDVTLVDDTSTEITMTVWGEGAKSAATALAGNPVVAVRRARVSEYGGRTLSASGGVDGVDTRPPDDLPEIQAVRRWWESSGGNLGASRSLSSAGGGGGKRDSLAERKCVAAIKEENLGHGGGGMGDGKPDWLSFKATVQFLKKDREGGAWYTACPNSEEPCKNRYKVTQTTDGQYYCEKCAGTFDRCVRRWIFSGVVEDSTGSTWVSFFNEQAEQLLGGGVTADDVYRESYEGDFNQDAYESVFAKGLHTEWIMKCKVKSELVNDESRIKTSVYSLHPVDYAKEANELLAEIGKF